jgi:hypothetical protein
MRQSPRVRAATRLSERLHRQLNMYAVAASAAGVGMLALAQPTEAKIVYTPTYQRFLPNTDLNIDLNNDGVVDFTLINSQYCVTYTSCEGFGQVNILNG